MKNALRLLALAALATVFALPAYAQDPAATPAAAPTGPCAEAIVGCTARWASVAASSMCARRTPRNPNYRPTTRCIAAPLETCSFTL